MKVIGYIRVSTDKQDLDKQRHLLLEYAQQKQWVIQEFIDAEVSANRDTKERKIDELRLKLQKGDILIVAELSRLGRNMLETLNIINELGLHQTPLLKVLNKKDRLPSGRSEQLAQIWGGIAVSALDRSSLRPLIAKMEECVGIAPSWEKDNFTDNLLKSER